MKILLAESGSTKTAWILIEGSKLIKKFETVGFNPFYYKSESLSDLLQHYVLPEMTDFTPQFVYYYGAGCSTEYNCNLIRNAFSTVFDSAEIKVMSDILGAAHALLANQTGIACVLGTGSNVCLYDGNKIIHQVPSLGYFFSDEGSGAYIGKKFLTAFMFGDLPEALSSAFQSKESWSREQILNKIYKAERPSLFLAQTARFVGQHINHPYCLGLVSACFDDFIHNLLARIPDFRNYPIGFTGAVAWHFRDILATQLIKQGLNQFHFIEDPSLELAYYYGVR